jgi:hypothetical protein
MCSLSAQANFFFFFAIRIKLQCKVYKSSVCFFKAQKIISISSLNLGIKWNGAGLVA